MLRSCSCVMSATYANTTENVTANTPDTEITAKYHLKQKGQTYTKAKHTSTSTLSQIYLFQYSIHDFSTSHEYTDQNHLYNAESYTNLT